MVYHISIILAGLLLIINRNFLINYYDRMNRKNDRPIDRHIVSVRLNIMALFFIVLGLYGIISG